MNHEWHVLENDSVALADWRTKVHKEKVLGCSVEGVKMLFIENTRHHNENYCKIQLSVGNIRTGTFFFRGCCGYITASFWLLFFRGSKLFWTILHQY